MEVQALEVASARSTTTGSGEQRRGMDAILRGAVLLVENEVLFATLPTADTKKPRWPPWGPAGLFRENGQLSNKPSTNKRKEVQAKRRPAAAENR